MHIFPATHEDPFNTLTPRLSYGKMICHSKVLNPLTKSCGVTIQMKPLWQCFHMVPFIQYVVLAFEFVVDILCVNVAKELCKEFLYLI